MPLPGLNISIIRQATGAARNQPVLISGKATAFGVGIPALVRVVMEGPPGNPERRTFDTLSRPVTGDYSLNVFSETEGQFTLQALAYAPLTVPIPGFPTPVLGPSLAESIEPPIIIGEIEGGQIVFDTEAGRRAAPLPPLSPVELSVNISPVINIGGDGGGGFLPPPSGGGAPDLPGQTEIIGDGSRATVQGRIVGFQIE